MSQYLEKMLRDIEDSGPVYELDCPECGKTLTLRNSDFGFTMYDGKHCAVCYCDRCNAGIFIEQPE